MDEHKELTQREKLSSSAPEAMPESNLTIGQLVDGRYKLLSIVGRGGMGSVFKVEQVYLHKEFALKTLIPGAMSQKAVMRFQSEAKAAGTLDHPGLATVRDFGVIENTQPFLIMDFIDGEPLSDRIKRGNLSLETALPILIQVAEALAYAHQKGIVHRDLKPANVMLTPGPRGQPRAVIIDFGIAKVLNAYENEVPSLTQTGEVFGSPMYMSPEQCAGTAIDARSDIYSFGCLMFETLTGSPPFFGSNSLATMLKHQNDAPPSLQQATLGTEFPSDLERVVARLLKKNPDERYQDMADVADHLTRIKNKTRVFADTTVNEPIKKTKSVPVNGIIVAAFVVVLAVSVFAFVKINSLTKELQQVKAELKALQAVERPMYFSRVDSSRPSLRVFEFPEKSIGTIEPMENSGCRIEPSDRSYRHVSNEIEAQGTIKVFGFTPGCLKVNMMLALLDDPSVITHFRSDEIGLFKMSPKALLGASHTIEHTLTNEDGLLKHISHLQSIRELNIGETKTTDACIPEIAKLEHLEKLSVVNTGVTGAGVAKLPQLQRLTKLDMNSVENVRPALVALVGSTNLTELDLTYDGITDADLKYIATMPNLFSMDLEGARITKDGLKQIVGLSRLSDLDLRSCGLPSDTRELFKHVHTVKIDFEDVKPKVRPEQLRDTIDLLGPDKN